jgi:hypothetical protein
MTDRATIILNTKADRERAIRWCGQIKDGTRVEFKAPRRSVDQNDKMWAMLADISKQVEWYGRKLSPTDWKCVFTSGLKKALVVPDLEGTGFVMIGLHTSDMTKDEMSNLIELITAFAAERGVTLGE